MRELTELELKIKAEAHIINRVLDLETGQAMTLCVRCGMVIPEGPVFIGKLPPCEPS